jgi:hypothetical protein
MKPVTSRGDLIFGRLSSDLSRPPRKIIGDHVVMLAQRPMLEEVPSAPNTAQPESETVVETLEIKRGDVFEQRALIFFFYQMHPKRCGLRKCFEVK